MSDKFKNIPVDKETKIIMESPMKWGELDIVYQKWYWDGITAESIIFLSDDVKDMDDEALEKDVRDGPLVQGDSKVTISRGDEYTGDEYTFVNFNFKT